MALAGPGGAVAGSLVTGASSATFTPSSALAANTTYTLTVGASSPGGTAMAPFTSTFTTETPVALVSTTPAANATGVALAATVAATFSGSVVDLLGDDHRHPGGRERRGGTLATTATSATSHARGGPGGVDGLLGEDHGDQRRRDGPGPCDLHFSTVSPAPVVATEAPLRVPRVSRPTRASRPPSPRPWTQRASTLVLEEPVRGRRCGDLDQDQHRCLVRAPPRCSPPARSTPQPSGHPARWDRMMTLGVVVHHGDRAHRVGDHAGQRATGVSNLTTVRATFSKAVSASTIRVTVTNSGRGSGRRDVGDHDHDRYVHAVGDALRRGRCTGSR